MKKWEYFSIFWGPFSCKVDGRCFTRLITGTRRVGSHFFQRIKKIPVLGIIMLIRFVVFRNHSLSSTKKRKKTLLKADLPSSERYRSNPFCFRFETNFNCGKQKMERSLQKSFLNSKWFPNICSTIDIID